MINYIICSGPNDMTSNVRINNEYIIGKDMERSAHGLIQGISPEFFGVTD